VKTQLTPYQGKLLNRKVSGAWQANAEPSNDSHGSNLLLFNNVLIDLANQCAWCHMNMSNVFATGWQN